MTLSRELFNQSLNIIPGGVNSPVRSFSSVGGSPLYIKSGSGPYIYDADNNSYIDFCGSWGPMILGHANKEIVKSIQHAASLGISFGTNTPAEVQMAQLIKEAFPSIDKVRLTTSGTEATMTALRLARAYTKRNKILKFDGCYHGHADAFLVKAGSGLLTSSLSSSAGIPQTVIKDTLVVPYNDLDAVKVIFEEVGKEIACVIVEPVAGNMGLVKPAPGFLEGLRETTLKYNSLLIFDEVITGFRLCFGGYQNFIKMSPDLTTLGKIIGGGLPIGAVGGKKEIMDLLAPLGGVYQAGTLSGNPVALAAGIVSLLNLKNDKIYNQLEEKTNEFVNSLKPALLEHQACIQNIGSMFTIYFQNKIPNNLNEMKRCDTNRFNTFFHKLLNNGVYFSPSQFEVNFISTEHTESILKTAANKIIESLN